MLTVLLKASFCIFMALLIQTTWTQIMPRMDNNIIAIRPVNFVLFINAKINHKVLIKEVFNFSLTLIIPLLTSTTMLYSNIEAAGAKEIEEKLGVKSDTLFY